MEDSDNDLTPKPKKVGLGITTSSTISENPQTSPSSETTPRAVKAQSHSSTARASHLPATGPTFPFPFRYTPQPGDAERQVAREALYRQLRSYGAPNDFIQMLERPWEPVPESVFTGSVPLLVDPMSGERVTSENIGEIARRMFQGREVGGRSQWAVEHTENLIRHFQEREVDAGGAAGPGAGESTEDLIRRFQGHSVDGDSKFSQDPEIRVEFRDPWRAAEPGEEIVGDGTGREASTRLLGKSEAEGKQKDKRKKSFNPIAVPRIFEARQAIEEAIKEERSCNPVATPKLPVARDVAGEATKKTPEEQKPYQNQQRSQYKKGRRGDGDTGMLDDEDPDHPIVAAPGPGEFESMQRPAQNQLELVRHEEQSTQNKGMQSGTPKEGKKAGRRTNEQKRKHNEKGRQK